MLAASSRPVPHRLILRFLLEYDLTAHEICRLMGNDVRGSEVRVQDKRGGSRTVELRADAAAELAELPPRGKSDQLLSGRSGTLRPEGIMRLLNAAAMEAELDERISIHRARRPADTPRVPREGK